ncbi:MAG: hypothetical protein PHQ25_01450 [Acidobacteriota bacterium]|nr:hypothetical protein [Acidobacteriota bacterium]MDW3229476.1 hypothetical protein [Acidobacteriota bacterium]
MEPKCFKITMILALAIIIFLPITGDLTAELRQEKPGRPFYNVDREITIEGQIEDIRFEQRYEKRASFLILKVRDKNTGEVYEVETAPAWFFQVDLHKGENIRLIGSLAEVDGEQKKLIMAREMRVQNQTITLRDRRGFPAWSGGQGRQRKRGG